MALTKVTKRVIADSSITSSMIVNGAINASHLSNITTDALTEGTNLYYTDVRVDSAIGDYLSGSISTGNITTTGYIRGPSTFTIDPATHGDDTGTLVISGNLQVDGTTTTINSTTVEVDDKNIVLASGAINAAAADGAGITIDGASATLTYNSTPDAFSFNKGVGIGTSSPATVSGGIHAVHDATEGTPTAVGDEVGIFQRNFNSAQSVAVSLISGSASTSNIYFGDNGDIDAGKLSWSNSSNSFSFSGGNVGIGTTNPTSSYDPVLHIYGTNPNLRLEGNAINSWAWISATTADSAEGRAFGVAADGSFRITADDTSMDNSVQFEISQAGNVGIGTSSPVAKLHVKTPVTAANLDIIRMEQASWGQSLGYLKNLTWHDGTANVGAIGMEYTVPYTSMHFHSFYASGYNTDKLFTISGSGNIGINASSPESRLHIRASSGSDSAGATHILFDVADDSGPAHSIRLGDTVTDGAFHIDRRLGGSWSQSITIPRTVDLLMSLGSSNYQTIGSGYGALSITGDSGGGINMAPKSGSAYGQLYAGSSAVVLQAVGSREVQTNTDARREIRYPEGHRSDRTAIASTPGFYHHLGWINATGNDYLHVKTNVSRYSYAMMKFFWEGYGYSDLNISGTMTVYTYGPQSTPYQPVIVNGGSSSTYGFKTPYYSSDDYLVLVLQHAASPYTGGQLFSQCNDGHGDEEVSILAYSGSNSATGVY